MACADDGTARRPGGQAQTGGSIWLSPVQLGWTEPVPPGSAPAEPRPAATVILVRPSAVAGFEVFMVHRNTRTRFAADVFVFPGGTVDAADRVERVRAVCPTLTPELALARLSERGGEPPATAELAFGLHVAALRELFEEAGVLLATDSAGRFLETPDAALTERLAAARGRLQAGQTTLAEIAEREGLRLAPERLIYFSHWITPAVSPRRYDTRFFVAAMPEGQMALHCDVETTEGVWTSPRAMLERSKRAEAKLVMVTVRHLKRLAAIGSVDELLALARSKSVKTGLSTVDGNGRLVENVEPDAW